MGTGAAIDVTADRSNRTWLKRPVQKDTDYYGMPQTGDACMLNGLPKPTEADGTPAQLDVIILEPTSRVTVQAAASDPPVELTPDPTENLGFGGPASFAPWGRWSRTSPRP